MGTLHSRQLKAIIVSSYRHAGGLPATSRGSTREGDFLRCMRDTARRTNSDGWLDVDMTAEACRYCCSFIGIREGQGRRILYRLEFCVNTAP